MAPLARFLRFDAKQILSSICFIKLADETLSSKQK